MHKSILNLALIGASSAFATPAFAAGLLGATLSEQYYFPDLSSPYANATYTPQTFTVGAGQESTIVIEGVTTFHVDFSDLTLNLVWDTTLITPTWNPAAFNGLVFTSTAFNNLSGVTINGSTNLANFDASRVSLAGNQLRLNWNGLTYDTNTVVALDFTAATAAVPEPATWATMILGFGLVGGVLRRRRQAKIRFA